MWLYHIPVVIIYIRNVLPSKNQVLYKLQSTGIHNDIMRKSHEQRLITKDHVAMLAYLNFMFKPVLYSSALVLCLVSNVQLVERLLLFKFHFM